MTPKDAWSFGEQVYGERFATMASRRTMQSSSVECWAMSEYEKKLLASLPGLKHCFNLAHSDSTMASLCGFEFLKHHFEGIPVQLAGPAIAGHLSVHTTGLNPWMSVA